MEGNVWELAVDQRNVAKFGQITIENLLVNFKILLIAEFSHDSTLGCCFVK